MSNEEILGTGLAAFAGVLVILVIALLALGLILYILQAIGLYQIAQHTPRKDLAWLAWIPVANTFLMALIVEDDVHESMRGRFTMIYGIAFVVMLVLGSVIPGSGLIMLAFLYYAFYFIAKRYSPNPVLHLVIAILTGSIGLSISLFMFRKREPKDGVVIDSV